MHEEEVLGKAYDARLMRRLLQYLRPYRWYVALGILLSILTSVFEAVRPYFTKIAVDVDSTPHAAYFDQVECGLTMRQGILSILLGGVM